MRKLTIFLFAMVLVFSQIGMAKSDVILFEDFEDSSGFTPAGCVPRGYWGIAPLEGTTTPNLPSYFSQGYSSQDGNIFYGSYAKRNSSSHAATMTIVLPDLSGYTNLELTVALAASERVETQRGIFEPTHRDSLRIIGLTTTSPPDVACWQNQGCQSVPGEIDSFLPITYPDHLVSNVHYPIGLGHEFQDFTYPIDSSLKSLTFAFASTDYPEKVGIDSVIITGDLLVIPIALDIKPGSCPNPINVKSKGVFPVAILGSADLDVTEIDVASLRLEGVAPHKSSFEDVATPFEPLIGKEDCFEDCTNEKKDGFIDLTLKFDTQAVVSALGEVENKDCWVLTLTGNLYGGSGIIGEDIVIIRKK